MRVPPCPVLPARRIGCPAFRIPGAVMKRHKSLLIAAAAGLRPSVRFQRIIDGRQQKMVDRTGVDTFNLMHLRVEKDWLALCEWWQKPSEGRDNCMNNTRSVGKQLQKHHFATEVGG